MVPAGFVPWRGDLPRRGKVSVVDLGAQREHHCPGGLPALSGGTYRSWATWRRGCGGLVVGESCCSRLEGFPRGFLFPAQFLTASEHIPFPSPVPGGIASESLTFTPLEDMIFLKWEEPVEPNGLITQYEVCPGRLWHPRGTRGDTGGSRWGRCSEGDLGRPLLSVAGIKGGCGVIVAPEPFVWRWMRPAFILCPCWGALLSGSLLLPSNGFSNGPLLPQKASAFQAAPMAIPLL